MGKKHTLGKNGFFFPTQRKEKNCEFFLHTIRMNKMDQ